MTKQLLISLCLVTLSPNPSVRSTESLGFSAAGFKIRVLETLFS